MTADDPVDKPAVVRLAADALRAAMAGDHPTAVQTVQTISDRHGGDGILITMFAWIDTLGRHLGYPGDRPVRIAWIDMDTGRITDASATPPITRWAGQLISARLAMDEETFRALIDSVGPGQYGPHIGTLLHCVATMMTNPHIAAPGRA